MCSGSPICWSSAEYRPNPALRRAKLVAPTLDGREALSGIDPAHAAASAYAQYVACPEADVALLPAGVDPTMAAAVCMSGLTALQTLNAAGLSLGQQVMVNGAAGGVGHLAVQIAVQIAVSRCARVTAVASGRDRDFVLSLGAARFVDYRIEDVPAAVQDMDIVVDCVGDDDVVTYAMATRCSA